MGLSAGGLIREGGLIYGSKEASETTNIIRKNEMKSLLVKMKKMYRIIRLFTH